MKPAITAALASLALASCAAPAPHPSSSEEWLYFGGYAGDRYYSDLVLRQTPLGLAGTLFADDGSAYALRAVQRTTSKLSFVAPRLGASFNGEPFGSSGWSGDWKDPGPHGDGRVLLEPSSVGNEVPALAAQLVQLPDGRRMHMVCAGEGAPVVILDYGAGGTMKKDWGDLAAAIAAEAKTRVCAYDRAGRGLSDPAAMPRDAAAVASDLDQMLTAAKIAPPYVLVGHSLGSYHVRQFANAYADKTAGLVLVDPSGDGQMERIAATIPKIVEEQNKLREAQADLGCIAKLRANPVPPDDPLATLCGGNDPDAFEATRSEIAEMPGASTASLVASRRSYGDMPLIVLTRGDYDKGMPPSMTTEDRAAMRHLWEAMHAEMAALSSRGEQRFIAGAGHYIQSDAPQAVIDAVRDVVAAARAKKS
jgi:pimeloyl-ACP methyl ester carboxylesterase